MHATLTCPVGEGGFRTTAVDQPQTVTESRVCTTRFDPTFGESGRTRRSVRSGRIMPPRVSVAGSTEVARDDHPPRPRGDPVGLDRATDQDRSGPRRTADARDQGAGRHSPEASRTGAVSRAGKRSIVSLNCLCENSRAWAVKLRLKRTVDPSRTSRLARRDPLC
jgi:hypothetical protein